MTAWHFWKMVLKKKRTKGLINSSKLPLSSLCQYRGDHNNVYFGDKCLNEKAVPQKASFVFTYKNSSCGRFYSS